MTKGSLVKIKKEIKEYDLLKIGDIAIVVSFGFGWSYVFLRNEYFILASDEIDLIM